MGAGKEGTIMCMKRGIHSHVIIICTFFACHGFCMDMVEMAGMVDIRWVCSVNIKLREQDLLFMEEPLSLRGQVQQVRK